MIAPGLKLRDIHPPPPPSWWPPAYGWWVLVACVLAAMVVLVWYARRKRRGLLRWKAVRDALGEMRARYPHEGLAWLAGQLSQWLRRAAIQRDAAAASMQGEAWRAFLTAHAPRGADVAPLLSLHDLAYRPAPQFDAEATLHAAEAWLRHVLTERSA